MTAPSTWTYPRGASASEPADGVVPRSSTRRALEPIAAQPAIDDSARWSLVDLERYEVVRGDTVVGYVDVVGPIFVALAGARYDRAVEVEQTTRFERAIAVLTLDAGRLGRR